MDVHHTGLQLFKTVWGGIESIFDIHTLADTEFSH